MLFQSRVERLNNIRVSQMCTRCTTAVWLLKLNLNLTFTTGLIFVIFYLRRQLATVF